MDTDYVVRTVDRTPAGLVTYHVTDLYGQRLHVTVPFRHSVPETVDGVIRRALEAHRPAKPAP